MALYSIQIRCHYVVPEYPAFQPWSYGYDVEDNYGNNQWKHEESHNPHEVKGSYGYKDNNGVYREVVYVADKDGFRANIKTNEPGSAQKDPAAVKMDSYHPNQNPSKLYIDKYTLTKSLLSQY